MSKLVKMGFVRLWTIKFGAGPTRTPYYHRMGIPGAVDQSYGDVERIEIPSDQRYGVWEEVDSVQGAFERPTLDITTRMELGRESVFKQLSDLRCSFDAQIHVGECSDPRNFDGGYEQIGIFENATATNYSTSEMGALQQSDDGVVNEEGSLSGQVFYWFYPKIWQEVASSSLVNEAIDVVVCDYVQCGNCENPSDGCSKVFIVTAPAGSSPGLTAEVVYSSDQLATTGDTWIDTLAIGEDPDGAACVGDYLVVISEDSESLHYAESGLILNGTETWTEVSTGFVAGNGPRAIHSENPMDTWIVGANGYVYKSTDVASGVSVQDAGVATSNNLNAIHGYDTEHLVAVGDTNTVIYTVDGRTWSAVTGPDTVNTPNLISVFMRSELEWWVGTNDNALWYTTDRGVTWAQSRFPGDTENGGGTGSVEDIVFPTSSVGWISHTTSAPRGRILQTHSGGNTWYLPRNSQPASDRLNAIGYCEKEPNRIYPVGLSDNGTDGFAMKGSVA